MIDWFSKRNLKKNKRDTILIVCKANYCRSPVAKLSIKEFLKNDIHGLKIDSAGTTHFYKTNMDPRSKSFLELKDINDTYHIPKKINKKLIDSSLLVLALDTHILKLLKNKYPKSQSKLRLFNILNPYLSTEDPYNQKDLKVYKTIMEDIYELSSLWASKIREEFVHKGINE